MSIGNLKLKLFTLIGTTPPNMRLVLLVGQGGQGGQGSCLQKAAPSTSNRGVAED